MPRITSTKTEHKDLSLLTLDQLVVGYAKTPLLPPIQLEVRKGELWALVGRNGSGKSTLLKTLLGMLPAVSGRARWAPDVHRSHVPQRGAWDDSVPARGIDMVRDGADRGWSFLRPWLDRAQRDGIAAAVEAAGAGELLSAPFATLSEGQRQRIWLARALASNPRVILMDEPTSALDAVAEEAAFSLFSRLCRERELAIVIASHHLAHLARFATHAVFVDRDSGVALSGPVSEVMGAQAYLRQYPPRSADDR